MDKDLLDLYVEMTEEAMSVCMAHGQRFSAVRLRVAIASNASRSVAHGLRYRVVVLGDARAMCSVDEVEQSQETTRATQLPEAEVRRATTATQQLRQHSRVVPAPCQCSAGRP